MKNILVIFLKILVAGMLLFSCKKDAHKVIPTVKTTYATNITSTSITIGVVISSDGGAPVVDRGVCWSTNQFPNILDNNAHTDIGTGKGSFTVSITGLSPGITYYIRAFATNGVGIAYGDQVIVITITNLPVVTTNAASSVLANTAICGGNISNDGGGTITSRGVCWSSNQEPTISDNTTSDGTGTGTFTSTVTGLTSGTSYYIRAYATNSAGTAYGNSVRVITSVPFIIKIQTNNDGTSEPNQMSIPFTGTSFNLSIDWGDSSFSDHYGPPVIHTYSVPGIYTVKIYGKFPSITFASQGDIYKLLSIEQWGNNKWLTFARAFSDCGKLVINATDLPDSGSVTDFTDAWFHCGSLSSFPLIDTSSGTQFYETWAYCKSLRSFPLINTSSGTNFAYAWTNCINLTSFPLINTGSGTNFSNAWSQCNSLTSFPLINTSSGIDFFAAWFGCSSLTSFPSINTSSGTNFSVSWMNCTNLTSFPVLNMNAMTSGDNCFSVVTLPVSTYSTMLMNLATSNHNNGVLFSGGYSKYNSAAVASRNILTAPPRNWTIKDGGLQ